MNARVDELERERVARADAHDRETAAAPIARAKAKNKEFMQNAWRQTNNGEGD